MIGLGVIVLVKLKYCPECGSLQIQALAFGQERCSSCQYTGEMKEGAPDEINAFKRGLKKSPSVNEILSGQVKGASEETVRPRLAKHYVPKPDIMNEIEL